MSIPCVGNYSLIAIATATSHPPHFTWVPAYSEKTLCLLGLLPLSPGKCPRKVVPYQATNGSCPVTDPTLMSVSSDVTTYSGPSAPSQPFSGPWGPTHYSTSSSLSCPPPPRALMITAPLQTPQDTGGSLRRGPVLSSQSPH